MQRYSSNERLGSKRRSRDVRSFLYAHTPPMVLPARVQEEDQAGPRTQKNGICCWPELTNQKAEIFHLTPPLPDAVHSAENHRRHYAISSDWLLLSLLLNIFTTMKISQKKISRCKSHPDLNCDIK